MNKKIGLLILSLLLFSSNRLFCQTLSENSEVSLLTIAPGHELFSFAGHTAIRVKDTQTGIDINFNYGVFDFRTEGFYLKFLKGTLPYQIGAYNFKQEVPYWFEENRTVTQQVLNLNLTQRQRVFDFLMKNYQPENREYNYKFFYDNCSTRVRDVLEETFGDSLIFSQTLNADKSFRDWLDIYNRKSNNDWTEFGMNLALGLPADEITGANRAMYIPDNLMAAFDSAKVVQNGKVESLVVRKMDLNNASIEHKPLPIKPFLLFSILFLIVAYFTFLEYQKKKWFLIIDKILFSLTGILGYFLLVLWFLTDHGVMNQNLNLLWAFPPVLPFVLFLNRQKGTQKWLQILFMIQAGLAMICILGSSFLPQGFHPAVFPIAGMILLRSFLIWKRKNSSN
ncbi:lipoprotein N-acyltransferase Lnb domain-containing protein [Arcticibacterium luteifluviistationis]|uniref:Uncharacterized protein n=1 Tax=Arcticibacterium luteifluviistationis TaxID=1784714 RepID=A0A2Z4GB28_9BACT|nr:DUF4105 domain-containing protein [Arcticibacterium luteifluviistationis]AWV98426.1 hypothetical protein DJ013_09665 [Arcticibacterium luteifluviistationis]